MNEPSAPFRPSSAQRQVSAISNSPRKNNPLVGTSPTHEHRRQSRISFITIPMNRVRQQRFSFFKNKKTPKKTTTDIAVEDPSKKVKDSTPASIVKKILAEKERVEAIKGLISLENYDAALSNLMSDTDSDLHYFNQVKGETMGEQHYDAFERKHGKLLDFQERPMPVEANRVCLWSGMNDFGHSLRCHNKCLYHPTVRVADQLGVERPKPLDFCVYHVKYCVNIDNHSIPMKIRVPNEAALCNECFIHRSHYPPKALMRVPGTRRKRG